MRSHYASCSSSDDGYSSSASSSSPSDDEWTTVSSSRSNRTRLVSSFSSQSTPRRAPAPKSPRRPSDNDYVNTAKMAARNGSSMTPSSLLAACSAIHAQLPTSSPHQRKKLKKELRDIVTEWNSYLDANILDLHYLLPDMAVSMVEERIRTGLDTETTLKVVTGRGRHSVGGVGIIKQGIIKYLQRHPDTLTYSILYDGALTVRRV